jgi:hypothetical protein
MARERKFKNPWAKGGDYYPDWLGDNSGAMNNDSVEETINQSPTQSALLCYGRGAELGNFEVFAKALKKNHLLKKYKEQNIQIVKTFNRIDLVNAILKTSLREITEIHIFSHSAGAGLFLGYHDPVYQQERANFLQTTPNPTYEEVIANETASLLTDHLVVTYASLKSSVQKKLENLQFAKLWGCNTGRANWMYDNSPYWAPLNTKNTPKPSMAQALSTYINKTVYGASSGSHIEYFVNGEWKSGYDYKPKSTKDYTDIRLHPDKGDYDAYSP